MRQRDPHDRRHSVDAINTRGVSAGNFASYRVLSRTESGRFCSQPDLSAEFDSRQLHQMETGQD